MPEPPESTPDPGQIERLLQQVRRLTKDEQDRILDAVDTTVANAVRRRLFSEAGTLYKPRSDPDPSSEDTRPPEFDSDPSPRIPEGTGK